MKGTYANKTRRLNFFNHLQRIIGLFGVVALMAGCQHLAPTSNLTQKETSEMESELVNQQILALSAGLKATSFESSTITENIHLSFDLHQKTLLTAGLKEQLIRHRNIKNLTIAFSSDHSNDGIRAMLKGDQLSKEIELFAKAMSIPVKRLYESQKHVNRIRISLQAIQENAVNNLRD